MRTRLAFDYWFDVRFSVPLAQSHTDKLGRRVPRMPP